MGENGSNHDGQHAVEDSVIDVKKMAIVAGVTMAGTLIVVARGKEILDAANTMDTDSTLQGLKEVIESFKAMLGA